MASKRSTSADLPAGPVSRGAGRADTDHRCDRCGVPAFVHVVLRSGRELALCGHHGRQHGAALIAAGAVVRDQTHRLDTSR